MNRTTSTMWRLALALGLASLACPVAALERNAALGAGGEVYLVQAGRYGELFPQGQETVPSSSVLALDVARPGAPVERLLVPGTKADGVESSPAVVFEENSNGLFIVWASQVNSIHSVLRLASYDGSQWSKPIQITSNEFSSKVSPLLAITYDAYGDVDIEGNPLTRHRTILHVWWQEENRQESFDLLYTPLILEDGHFLGWNPVYNLSTLFAQEEVEDVPAPPLQLIQAPAIQRGRDARTVNVGLVDAASHRLVTLEIDLLPEELGRLGEKARAAIIDMGQQGMGRQTLATKTSEAILKEERSFQPEVLSAIAAHVHALILDTPDEPNVGLGDKARAAIIDMGARMSDRGLRPGNRESKSRIESVEREYLDDGTAEAAVPHLLRFRVASTRPSPAVGPGAVKLFVSESGDNALVSWTKSDRVFYRLSETDGWTDPKEIRLSEAVTLEKAYELLESKVRNR